MNISKRTIYAFMPDIPDEATDIASVVEDQSTNNNKQFNINAAIAYNIKSEPYFKKYEDEIKRVLGTSADWSSSEFAQAVYNWQKNNGFDGNWVDGKFGAQSMGKMTKIDSNLKASYDPYSAYKQQHADDKPYKRVIELMPEIERIKKELGADNIPTQLLTGWIQVESGGKVDNLTTSAGFREAGLFQVSEDEAKTIGVDQNELLTNTDASIKAGILLAQHYAGIVDNVLDQHQTMKQYFNKDTIMYWQLVMFAFSAGSGTMTKLVSNMDNSGEVFNNWDDVMTFAAQNPGGYKHNVGKWAAHVGRAFSLGDQMVARTAQAKKIQLRIKNAKRKARIIILGDIN